MPSILPVVGHCNGKAETKDTTTALSVFAKGNTNKGEEIYNTERPHFSLYMQTPEQTHLKENIKIRTYKKEKSDHRKTV